MLTTKLILSVFSLLFVFSGLSVISSTNPVYGVLSLIVCFFNATTLLLSLGIEFVPVSFIIIYVGAIAVLFVFVLMMLNIKAAELKQNSLMLVPVIVTLGFVFWLQLFVLFNTDFNILTTNFFNLSFFVEFSSSYNISKFLSWLFLPQNIASLGQMLFGVNSFEFLLTSLILFVAMVSSIALTLDKQFSAKTQKTLFQILTHQSDVIQSYR